MTNEYVLMLDDVRATLENAGGKGASLARLTAAGLPVPGGFHVSTAAYRAFVAAHDLQERILAAVSAADPDRPATLEAAAAAIGEVFAQGEVPPAVAEAVRAAYEALPRPAGAEPAVAVRSSATAEDLPDASFAGQQETYLNIRGAEAVLSAVKRCWASLWTARAIAYRLRNHIDQGSVALAVVVQELVSAEASGILFTANPVNGRRDQVMITATWGLGEAIVGGLVTPDTLALDKTSGRVLSRETADKQVMTVRTDLGTAEQPTPEALRRAPVLNDEQAAALTGLGVQIEELYGMPMDIEWALAEGRFAIVQARPITALPACPGEGEPTLPPPAAWLLPNPKATYSRASLAEHLPNPVSPLFGTLGLRLANEESDRLMRTFKVKLPRQADYGYKTINGYVYLGLVMDAGTTWSIVKLSLSQIGFVLRGGTGRWRQAREALVRAIAGWEARPVTDLSPSALLEGARELMRESARFYTVIQAGTLPAASMSETLFTRLYGLVKRRGDPDATVFLFGSDTAALRAEKSLFDLAAWAAARPALRDYALHTPVGDLAADLRGEQAPEGVPTADWLAWRSRFEAHLREHCRNAYEFDFANPTPAETPETALDAVRMYLEGKGNNPYERQREALEKRERATRQVLGRFMLFPKAWFKKALRWAQECGPAREDSIADMGMAYPTLRRLLGELGRRLAAHGAIQAADDIYWLVEDEVSELAALLERGEPLPAYGERTARRRAEWRAQLRAVAPALLPQTSRWSKMMPGSGENESGEVLKGLGTSAGRVTARACVLLGPEEFGRMKPGDVLVAVTTTPAWTPLFAMASAVVTDIGGPLSHSSIVAREYGIPAIMATGTATRRIRSGDVITVDGGAGVVTLGKGRA